MKRLCILFLSLTLTIFPVTGGGYPLQSPARQVLSEVRTYNWTSAKGWFRGQITKIYRESYDKEGRLILREFFYKDMIPAEITEYTYKENMVKKTTRNSENVVIRNVLVQNEDDKRTETVLRGDGTLFYKTVSVLRNNGEVMELSYYNGQEQLVYNKVFEYTRTGDVKKISMYNPDNSLAIAIDIVYEEFDDMGNWVSRSEYYTYGDVRKRPRDSVHREIQYGGDADE